MTRPSPVATYALTAAMFLVVLMLLAWQVRAGNDPAIGAAKPEPAAKRVIVVKRIERRVIITEPAAAPVAAAPAASGGGSAPAASAPVATSAPAAPAAAAPAPAAPAAPAPALSTRSS